MINEQKEFIEKIKNGAILCHKEYGVLPSLTLAQSILESGWGSCAIGNNVFGIKAGTNWTGKTREVETDEYIDRTWIKVSAIFRDYDSIEESILDHGKLLMLDRYKPVIASKNYVEACTQVYACGYATDPLYTDKLIAIIAMYELDKFDLIQFTSPIEAIDFLYEKGRIREPEMWKREIENGVINYIWDIFIRWANDIRRFV